MNILKTFDIFYRESMSVLKERIINILFIETKSAFKSDSCIYTELKSNQEAQIAVFNNQKVYNLLTCALAKYKQKQENENIKS